MKHLALTVCATMVIATLPATSADSTGPLSAGGAAGVQQAQSENDKTLYNLAGVGILAALAILIFANNDGGGGISVTSTCGALPVNCVPTLIPHVPAGPLAPISTTTTN